VPPIIRNDDIKITESKKYLSTKTVFVDADPLAIAVVGVP
jgi:hypothetical protein